MEGINNKCFLCLKTGLDVINIERRELEKLKYVLLNVKIWGNCVWICKTCKEKIGDLFEYKTCLIEALKRLIKCSSQNASCHLCENINTSTMFLSEILKDLTLHEVFKTYIIEIKLDKETDPLICVDCQHGLSKFSSWVNTWQTINACTYSNTPWANNVLEYQNSDKDLSDGQTEIINDLLQASDATDVTLGINQIREISGEPKEITNDLLKESMTIDVTPSIEISGEPNSIITDLLKESVTTAVTPSINYIPKMSNESNSIINDLFQESETPFINYNFEISPGDDNDVDCSCFDDVDGDCCNCC